MRNIQSGLPYRKASDKWGIPCTTLHDRNNGTVPRTSAHTHEQRLSETQEKALATWCLTQADLGLAPTHFQIRYFAQRILANGGDIQPLGKHWMAGFFRRNPKVKTLKGQRIDSARIKSVTTDAINGLFGCLKNPEVKDIPPERRYNMDEIGIMEGQGVNGLVVGHAERKRIYVKSPETRVWTSILECISTAGISIDPLIIFRGKSVRQ